MLNLNFQPFPVLETERLILRRPTIGDAPGLFELRTSDDAMHYVERPRPKSIDDAVAYVNEIGRMIDKREVIQWTICLRSDDRFIGNIGYWRMKPEHFRAEVGYMLLPRYWRQGYMSEALGAVLDYGFERMNAHSIEAALNPANEGSIKLLEKFGFVREAYFREDYFWEGRFLDTAVYSLIRRKV
jgi:ribosomal-protein-alanine N-acetyltransferase